MMPEQVQYYFQLAQQAVNQANQPQQQQQQTIQIQGKVLSPCIQFDISYALSNAAKLIKILFL